jgi:hypothetical protein
MLTILSACASSGSMHRCARTSTSTTRRSGSSAPTRARRSEWLEERDVDRSLLAGRRPGFMDAAIRRDAAVRRCAPLDVVLFKGTASPGNAMRAAIHRSPSHMEPRLLLTIDPLG